MSPANPNKAPSTAYCSTLHGRLNMIPDHTPQQNTVRKSDVENSAKNAMDDLPLLLHKKCHKLCNNNEMNMRMNAVKVILSGLLPCFFSEFGDPIPVAGDPGFFGFGIFFAYFGCGAVRRKNRT